jgi:hypothetical protein
MFRFFASFLTKMASRFKGIAYATKSGLTDKDLHSDAWIAANEISEKRGREVDFSDPDDQELVLSQVYKQSMRQRDWRLRTAIRIDQDRESDDGAIKWSERLPAHASSDPLVSLLLQESAFGADVMLTSSYSQAAAYVVVFVHFKNNREEVCSYLAISDGTLSRRVTFAADTVRVQPSLFDRIERIGASFMPQPGRQYAVRIDPQCDATQWRLEF